MATIRKPQHRAAPTKTTRRPVARRTRSNGKSKPIQSGSERERLKMERAQVMAELARLRAEMQETPSPTGDEVDLNVYEREKTLGLIAAFELRLQKVEHALRAAEMGKYGICERCGSPIDPERLAIFPATRHCVNCKNEVEQRARRGLA